MTDTPRAIQHPSKSTIWHPSCSNVSIQFHDSQRLLSGAPVAGKCSEAPPPLQYLPGGEARCRPKSVAAAGWLSRVPGSLGEQLSMTPSRLRQLSPGPLHLPAPDAPAQPVVHPGSKGAMV